MNKVKAVLKETLLSFWFFSVLLVFLCVAIAVFQYRSIFGGDLATASIEFANFGAYMGGIFGPLVSFVTLLAVLKTVYLQRELLDTQKNEFKALLLIQEQASDKQDKQISYAKEDAQRSKVQHYQVSVLNLIQTFITRSRREAEQLYAAADKIISLAGNPRTRITEAEALHADRRVIEGKINDLIVLALEISITEYEAVSDIAEVFSEKIKIILDIDD